MAGLSKTKPKVKKEDAVQEDSVGASVSAVEEQDVNGAEEQDVNHIDGTEDNSSDLKEEDAVEDLSEPPLDLPKVEVTTDADSSKIPEPKNVRIKMRRDFSFTYGGVVYDLKKGQCYNVPPGVRKHLNKYNVLMPLL